MKPLKEKITLSLDDDVVEKIKLLADEQERSLSQYINLVLKRHLERRAKKDAEEKD